MEVVDRIDQRDAEVVRGLYVELRRFAAAVAPPDVDPDDVLHDVLVKVMRPNRLREVDEPGAYLRRAIVNQIRSDLRRRKIRRETLHRLRTSTSEAAAATYPSDVAELMRLQPVERAVLFLFDIEGFTFEEVADMVGIKAGNARVIASRARRRLRSELLEEDRR